MKDKWVELSQRKLNFNNDPTLVGKYNNEVAITLNLPIGNNLNTLILPADTVIKNVAKKDKQFFDLKDFTDLTPSWKALFKDRINTYIINLEKNAGKTVWMRTQCNMMTQNIINYHNGTYTELEKFALIFRSKENKDTISGEIRDDDNFNYYIKGKTVYSKGIKIYNEETGQDTYEEGTRNVQVGYVLEFNTMHNSSSMQWENVTKVFWDEYRSKEPLPPAKANKEFDKFLTMQSNIQRGKKNIHFFLFGNNEPSPDYIGEAFKVDKTMQYLINPARKFAYINIPAWEGLEEGVSLSKLNSDLSPGFNQFINYNISDTEEKGVISQNDIKANGKFWGYLVFNATFYRVTIYQATKDQTFWILDEEHISVWKKEKNHCITLGLFTTDLLLDKRILEMDNEFLSVLATYYQYDILHCSTQAARDKIKEIFKSALPRMNYQESMDRNYFRKIM